MILNIDQKNSIIEKDLYPIALSDLKTFAKEVAVRETTHASRL